MVIFQGLEIMLLEKSSENPSYYSFQIPIFKTSIRNLAMPVPSCLPAWLGCQMQDIQTPGLFPQRLNNLAFGISKFLISQYLGLAEVES